MPTSRSPSIRFGWSTTSPGSAEPAEARAPPGNRLPRRPCPGYHAPHGPACRAPETEEDVMEYRIISAEDHIDMQWLPKDLWHKRVPSAWRERAPQVVETADGPYWVCGDDRWGSWGGRKGAAGAPGGPRMALDRGGAVGDGALPPPTTAPPLA